MFHEDILYIYYCKYIKTKFLISYMHCLELHSDNFKGDFYFFCTPRFPKQQSRRLQRETGGYEISKLTESLNLTVKAWWVIYWMSCKCWNIIAKTAQWKLCDSVTCKKRMLDIMWKTCKITENRETVCSQLNSNIEVYYSYNNNISVLLKQQQL